MIRREIAVIGMKTDHGIAELARETAASVYPPSYGPITTSIDIPPQHPCFRNAEAGEIADGCKHGVGASPAI